MIEQRQVHVKLLPMGKYSKVLVLPKWWLKLNGNPETVEMNLALGFLTIKPLNSKEPQKAEVGGGKPG